MMTRLSKVRKILFSLVLAALTVAVFSAGYWLGNRRPNEMPLSAQSDLASGGPVTLWTCSMHPQIKVSEPGMCPICGMELIPAHQEQDETLGPREIRLSETARKLAEIEVADVQRRFVETEVRMFGKFDYDETLLKRITAWTPGRLDRLYVDYTGIPVKKGEHLVYLYSPDLITAQQELLQSLKGMRDLQRAGLEAIRGTAQETVKAARDRLRLWGLTQAQIDEIEQRGTPTEHVTIHSPISGIVIEKSAVEGMYVSTGTTIYTIADLSQLWLKLDAYESDLVWIRYGQKVTFQVKAYPGKSFSGTIAFIDPILDERTRTVKVRVNVSNSDGRLKPGMFATAIVRSKIAGAGKVIDPDFEGKWICPMHPEVVQDAPGSCDRCGMPLESSVALGYTSPDAQDTTPPLVIPSSAPLITGKRAVVYVMGPDAAGSLYEGRDVVLGPQAGDYYIVESGLQEGEQVVVHGSFKIDSAVQIQGGASMMNPEASHPTSVDHVHGLDEPLVPESRNESTTVGATEFFSQLDEVFRAYFAMHKALSLDDLSKARSASKEILTALDSVRDAALSEQQRVLWKRHSNTIRDSAERIESVSSLQEAREIFEVVSNSLTDLAKRIGTSGELRILRFRCPMAFANRGAEWLQNETDTQNPYFGSSMFRCGEQTEVISPGEEHVLDD